MRPYLLISQVCGEANPINMVTKLSQLTSLLSSIEDKVFGGSCSFSWLLCGPLSVRECPGVQTLCSLCLCPKGCHLPFASQLKGLVHVCPQVKALLHEGPESPHRRSLIPPVTFEVSGCTLVLPSWRLGDVLSPVEGGLLAHLNKGKEPRCREWRSMEPPVMTLKH